jgi:pSer/pThr/pTyr-binding forkhead associated (FHA) protein
MTKLYIIDGPDRGRSFDIGKEATSIGRSPSNHIQLKDPYVSRRHLTVLRKGDTYFIKDLKSKNGTCVDGEPLSPRVECEVKEGVPIVIGVTLI